MDRREGESWEQYADRKDREFYDRVLEVQLSGDVPRAAEALAAAIDAQVLKKFARQEFKADKEG